MRLSCRRLTRFRAARRWIRRSVAKDAAAAEIRMLYMASSESKGASKPSHQI
jgi:hypothetical protein